MTARPLIPFDNTFAAELDGLYSPWKGDQVPKPTLVQLNRGLAESLGIDPRRLESAQGAAILCGSTTPEGATPLAQAYAGHQFGSFVPQLGDGRALLLGEVVDRRGVRRDLHLKGSGPTPFSRGGDGKAGIGPVLREYLVSEFMHAAGVPTTRALAAVLTGETIVRQAPQPGAVLARVASSHLRVGTFQYFAARGETDKLRRLADYTIRRHDPDLQDTRTPYLGLLEAVVERQAGLVAKWMGLGFVHGVMNTDNTTVSGETIDYGPCAFIDAYRPQAVFSSIDRRGRYAFGNQPPIAQWNLLRFAEALLGLIDPDVERAVALATPIVEEYPVIFERRWLEVMGAKLGLEGNRKGDGALVQELLDVLADAEADFTSTFRELAAAVRGDEAPIRQRLSKAERGAAWLESWRTRAAEDSRSPERRAAVMDAVNPVYIPRNHLVEEAVQAAEGLDFKPFRSLLGVLTDPFRAACGKEAYAAPAPGDFGPYVTFCGT